jgi:hypothetical protein
MMAARLPQTFVVSMALALQRCTIGKRSNGGLEASQLKRIKELEEENNKLKRMYADVSIQRDALKDLIEKKL